MQNILFPEISTLTDIELDVLIETLRTEVEKLGHKTGSINVERRKYHGSNRLAEYSSWSVVVLFDKDSHETVIGIDKFLHLALSKALTDVKSPFDTMAYLGFVDHPLSDK